MALTNLTQFAPTVTMDIGARANAAFSLSVTHPNRQHAARAPLVVYSKPFSGRPHATPHDSRRPMPIRGMVLRDPLCRDIHLVRGDGVLNTSRSIRDTGLLFIDDTTGAEILATQY